MVFMNPEYIVSCLSIGRNRIKERLTKLHLKVAAIKEKVAIEIYKLYAYLQVGNCAHIAT